MGDYKNVSKKGEAKKEAMQQLQQQQNNMKSHKNQVKKKFEWSNTGLDTFTSVPNQNNKMKKLSENKKNQNKYKKKNNNNYNNRNNNETSNKNKGKKKEMKNQLNENSGGILRRLLYVMFFAIASTAIILGFLYIVDIQKYHSVLAKTENALLSALRLLPIGVIKNGEVVYSNYVKPTVVVAVGKVFMLVNQTTTVLKANPVIKEHWSNINEISYLVCERLADYLRTVYNQTSIYYVNARNNLF